MKREKVKSFEQLWIWQQARQLVREVYSDFADGCPGSRDFGFRSQLQKAAVSIMNNVAEGFERKTDADFARFLDIARDSCGELRSMYYTAEDLQYTSTQSAEARRGKAKQIAAGIASLAAHLRTPRETSSDQ